MLELLVQLFQIAIFMGKVFLMVLPFMLVGRMLSSK